MSHIGLHDLNAIVAPRRSQIAMELSSPSAYHKNPMSWIRTSARRTIAITCLAMLAFAQLAFAAQGCFGSRTSAPVSDEGCTLERLLCSAHCQAEEQASGGVDLSIPDVADFSPLALIAVTWLLSADTVRTPSTRESQRARPPPPFSVNLRLLN